MLLNMRWTCSSVIRFQEDNHEEVRSIGQGGAEPEQEDQEERSHRSYRHRTSGPSPDIRYGAMGLLGKQVQMQVYSYRTSGGPQSTGHPVLSENPATHVQYPNGEFCQKSENHQTSRRPQPPDFQSVRSHWTLDDHRTSSAFYVQLL